MSEILKAQDEKFCSECGAVIRARAEICPKCGVRQSSPFGSLGAVAPNGKSRLAAILFAVLLGTFGIHKFYLGKIGWGLLYLAFSWTFIPTVIGIIEGILLSVMSDAEFNKRHGGA